MSDDRAPAPEPADDPVATEVRKKNPPRLDGDGRERPKFLLAFPNDPELSELVAAFERGDFASVREGAPRLAESTRDESVKAAALELQRRIKPAPLVLLMLGLSLGLLVFLITWAYVH